MGFLDLLTSMILNDLELSIKGFSEFFCNFLAHISRVNCDEMAGVAYSDVNNSSLDPLGLQEGHIQDFKLGGVKWEGLGDESPQYGAGVKPR